MGDARLTQLVQQDQAERAAYSNFVKTKAAGNWETGARLYAKAHNRPANDVFGEKQRLQQFTKMQWEFQSFAKQDWHHYWLLVQHCDWDRKFQQTALATIKKHCGTSTEFKYLSDRISCGLHGSQAYGTQDICEADDETAKSDDETAKLDETAKSDTTTAKLRLSTKQPNLLTPAHPSFAWFYALLSKGLKTTKLGGRAWNVEPAIDNNIRVTVASAKQQTERLVERLLAGQFFELPKHTHPGRFYPREV